MRRGPAGAVVGSRASWSPRDDPPPALATAPDADPRRGAPRGLGAVRGRCLAEVARRGGRGVSLRRPGQGPVDLHQRDRPGAGRGRRRHQADRVLPLGVRGPRARRRVQAARPLSGAHVRLLRVTPGRPQRRLPAPHRLRALARRLRRPRGAADGGRPPLRLRAVSLGVPGPPRGPRRHPRLRERRAAARRPPVAARRAPLVGLAVRDHRVGRRGRAHRSRRHARPRSRCGPPTTP